MLDTSVVSELAARRPNPSVVRWVDVRDEDETLLVWGELTAGLERKGRPMPAIDSRIAASVFSGDFLLVTRKEDDFADSGVRLVNPWHAM